MRHVVVSTIALSCIAAVISTISTAGVVRADDDELVPTGKGWGERPAPGPGPGQGAGQGQGNAVGQAKPSGPGGSSNGIDYHGGPVMLGKTNMYYIWYGNWSGNTATTILEDLAHNISGSAYFNINTTYYNASGTHVSNSVGFGGSTTNAYAQGTALSDSAIKTV